LERRARQTDKPQHGFRLLDQLGEKALGGSNRRIQGTEVMVVGDHGPQPAPDLLLQDVALRRQVVGQQATGPQ
jgi:hypothetical protein